MKIEKLIFIIEIIFLPVVAHSQNNAQTGVNTFLEGLQWQEPHYMLHAIDSIEKVFPGNLSEDYLYYWVKSNAYLQLANYEQQYKILSKGIELAKKEKNYKWLGDFYLVLSDTYRVTADSVKYNKYLDKAKQSYLLGGLAEDVLQVDQSMAISYTDEGKYEKSNAILLNNLLAYKQAEDVFLLLMGLSYIAQNYLSRRDKANADIYINDFKKLKGAVRDDIYEYYLFEIYNKMAYYHKDFKQELDSALLYVNMIRVDSLTDLQTVRINYETRMDIYSAMGNHELYKAYKDSLFILEDKLRASQFNENVELLEENNDIKTNLENTHTSNKYIKSISLWAGTLIIFILTFLMIRRRKLKRVLADKSKKLDEQDYNLKNHDKLIAKLKDKDKVLNVVTAELKNTLKLNRSDERDEKVKDLFIQLNTRTSETPLESNYDELCNLNLPFFVKLSEIFPTLNESEQVLCYYIFMKFKNSEIANFLNLSVRAVEGRRYRIRKKIELKKDILLIDVINDLFD